jgi:hypothetical protein
MLKRLHEAVHRKSPKLWLIDYIFHHSNVPCHSTASVKQFVVQESITEMEHLPCSPDMAPNDFWLFPKIKSALKGRRFRILKTPEKLTALEAIPQQDFQKIFPTVAASFG